MKKIIIRSGLFLLTATAVSLTCSCGSAPGGSRPDPSDTIGLRARLHGGISPSGSGPFSDEGPSYTVPGK